MQSRLEENCLQFREGAILFGPVRSKICKECRCGGILTCVNKAMILGLFR